MPKLLLLQTILRGSYLLALWLLIVTWNLLSRKKRIRGILFLIAFRLFLRARRIEPNSLRVRQHEIPLDIDLRVALIADVHL